MAYWMYKCNARKLPYQRAWGDWAEFFNAGKVDEWGSTEWIPQLREARRGDVVLAFQSDRNELVGVARVVGQRRAGRFSALLLRPVEQLRVKVRPLKEQNPRIRVIPALQPGIIRTLYPISARDARALVRSAKATLVRDSDAAASDEVFAARGGGFGTAARNRKVEGHAIRFVRRFFRDRGWRVKDLSAQRKSSPFPVAVILKEAGPTGWVLVEFTPEVREGGARPCA
jgi:hypothetical protein